MELYVLDSLFRSIEVVEKYVSFIWTERFNSAGDFELLVESTPSNRSAFTPGMRFALSDSVRCMETETVEDATDEEGRKLLKISGPSIEFPIMDNRVAFNVKDDLTTNPKWVITDAPADVARKVFQDICVTGVLDTDDIVPFITAVAVLPDDTIPEPPDDITVEIEPDTVYNVVKPICEAYDLGFRIVRNGELSQLAFDIYTGTDRTSMQTALPTVLFSLDLNNLKSTSRLESDAGMKNVAYVYSNLGFEEVVALDVNPSISGFERKVLVVKMDDFDVGTSAPVVSAMMQQKGKEELAKCRGFIGFDGEVSEVSEYKYGVDYQLGDLVEIYGEDGYSSIVRVTEQIFASDEQGQRSYPTLSAFKVVTPGSWASMGAVQWVDYEDDLTTYWKSMP
jgi:hypothetical protein